MAMVLLPPTTAKHLVEEAKLRSDGARKGEEYEAKKAHPLL